MYGALLKTLCLKWKDHERNEQHKGKNRQKKYQPAKQRAVTYFPSASIPTV